MFNLMTDISTWLDYHCSRGCNIQLLYQQVDSKFARYLCLRLDFTFTSDQGTQFNSTLSTKLIKLNGVDWICKISYHSQWTLQVFLTKLLFGRAPRVLTISLFCQTTETSILSVQSFEEDLHDLAQVIKAISNSRHITGTPPQDYGIR